MVNNGKMYSLPSGQRVWIDDSTINPLRFITKDEFEKQSKGMNAKFVAHACISDKISNRKVDLYYFKSKNNSI